MVLSSKNIRDPAALYRHTTKHSTAPPSSYDHFKPKTLVKRAFKAVYLTHESQTSMLRRSNAKKSPIRTSSTNSGQTTPSCHISFMNPASLQLLPYKLLFTFFRVVKLKSWCCDVQMQRNRQSAYHRRIQALPLHRARFLSWTLQAVNSCRTSFHQQLCLSWSSKTGVDTFN